MKWLMGDGILVVSKLHLSFREPRPTPLHVSILLICSKLLLCPYSIRVKFGAEMLQGIRFDVSRYTTK